MAYLYRKQLKTGGEYGRARGIERVQQKFAQRYAQRGQAKFRLSATTKGEFKSVDSAITTLTCDTTGSLLLLNGIARGDDINERVGREVIMKSIELKLFNYSVTDTGLSQGHRMMLVYDTQANATAPTILQILSTTNVLSQKNLENRQRFRILMDETILLGGQTANSTTDKQLLISRRYKKLNLKTQFNSGDAGTIADITTGSLYFIAIGTRTAGTTAGSVNVSSRVRYTDK